jgi:hypothetical protein
MRPANKLTPDWFASEIVWDELADRVSSTVTIRSVRFCYWVNPGLAY